MVALYLDNSTAKAYLCNQGDIASAFLSTLACCILNLADKQGINVISAYIPIHLNVKAISWGRFVPEQQLLSLIAWPIFYL